MSATSSIVIFLRALNAAEAEHGIGRIPADVRADLDAMKRLAVARSEAVR